MNDTKGNPSLKSLARKVLARTGKAGEATDATHISEDVAPEGVGASFPDIELHESTKRLEAANILLSVSTDGVLRLHYANTADASAAAQAGAAIYTAIDMAFYVRLNPEERRIVRELKAIH